MNNKTKIAELLFSTDAPSDLILWNLSHLPDENIVGKNNKNRKTNHKSKKIYTAFGMTEKEWDSTHNKLNDLIINSFKFNNISEIVESLKKEIGQDEELLTLLYVRFVKLVQEDFERKQVSNMFESFLKSLKK
jgi:hypothetical protein